MLTQLKAIHAELRDAIAALQAETSRPAPEAEALTAARLRLSRLSGRRRALIEQSIYPQLRDLSADDARKIADLRRETTAHLGRSSKHIGRWTMGAILTDWQGYQRAAAEMRVIMLGRIASETAILYPLLGAKDARRAA